MAIVTRAAATAGDRIVGIVATGKGVTIHPGTADLESPATPERFIDVDWDASVVRPEGGRGHTGRIRWRRCQDGAMSDHAVQARRTSCLRIANRQADFFEMLVDVEVRDLRQLVNVIASLRAAKGVHQVERARG